jgi:hypothetical protein
VAAVPDVFLSYRRKDNDILANSLRDGLESRIGSGSVFLDTEGIAIGADFRDAIDTAISAVHTMLVLIGPEWNPQRLSESQDFVRSELEAGRRLGKRIVPVLHGGVDMPSAADLPDSLSWLCSLNAHTIGSPPKTAIARLVEQIHGFHRSAQHRSELFIAGSDAESNIEQFATAIGAQLASTGITVCSATGKAGVHLSMAMCTVLRDRGSYSPERANFYLRYRESAPPQLLPERFGTVRYSGLSDKPSMIAEILERCRATIIIGGGPGSEAEARQSIAAGIPVIPIAASEGAARRIWQAMSFQQEPIAGLGVKARDDFELLAGTKQHQVVQAAIRLIELAME